jgi:2-polyprenyl-3-methyl-5-hydroxy-6-metoxy-1,4-benzoquinol methylase
MDLSVLSSQLEIMDTTPLAPTEMARTLDFLTLTNKCFGGAAVVTRYLDQWTSGGEDVSILDVGTGAADIPLAIAAWARRRGVRVRILGLDLVSEIVGIAKARTRHEPSIEIRGGDLFALAESPERFDYVTASLFLHHMPGDQAARALSAFDRLASRGVIISDLARSHFGYATVGLASWLLGNRVVRHDGPLSVARSFQVDELQALARSLNLDYLRARSEPWCRLSLAGRKP